MAYEHTKLSRTLILDAPRVGRAVAQLIVPGSMPLPMNKRNDPLASRAEGGARHSAGLTAAFGEKGPPNSLTNTHSVLIYALEEGAVRQSVGGCLFSFSGNMAVDAAKVHSVTNSIRGGL